MNLSRRSYALIAALVLSLLTVVYLGTRGSREAAGEAATWPADDPCVKDAPHPGVWDEKEPRLLTLSYGYSSKSAMGGEKHFTIGASINVGRRPLVLHPPLARGGVSVRFCAPYGKGVMAEAKGLSPKSVETLAAKLRLAAELGLERVDVYHYGFAPLATLDLIQEARAAAG